jgi:hypothetical protein
MNAKHCTAFCVPNIKVMLVSQARSISQYEIVNRQAMYLKGNIKGLSRNHGYRGRAISNTLSESLSVTLAIQHATPYYTAICGLSGYTIFSHIIS